MILVDSSVWIDYFRGTSTPQSDLLDSLLGKEDIATGDLILAEVLQGFGNKRDYAVASRLFDSLNYIDIGGRAIAMAAAENFRHLRARGVTVRKTIDTLIATRCIIDDIQLLHSDRDFDAFAEHLGLRSIL